MIIYLLNEFIRFINKFEDLLRIKLTNKNTDLFDRIFFLLNELKNELKQKIEFINELKND